MVKSKTQKTSKSLLAFLRVLLIVSFCMSVIFFYFYLKTYFNYHRLISVGVNQAIPGIVSSFDNVFKELVAEGNRYADQVADTPSDLDSLNNVTQNFLKSSASIGTIIDISPTQIYEFNRDLVHKKVDADLLQQILKRERSGWLTTFRSELSGVHVVAYAVKKNNRIIITLYPVSMLQKLADQLATNEAIIESMDVFDERTTQILVSPIKGARFKKTLIELAKNTRHDQVVERLQNIIKTKKGGEQLYNRKSGDPVTIIYKNIKHTPWFLSIFYKKEPLNDKYVQMCKTSYWFILCVIPFITSGMILLHLKYINKGWSAWIIALSFSAMCLVFSMYILSNASIDSMIASLVAS